MRESGQSQPLNFHKTAKPAAAGCLARPGGLSLEPVAEDSLRNIGAALVFAADNDGKVLLGLAEAVEPVEFGGRALHSAACASSSEGRFATQTRSRPACFAS